MYNSIFAKVVFYLDKIIKSFVIIDFVDLYGSFHYNILVYVLMEFREHAIFINQYNLLTHIIKEKNNEKNLSA